MKRNAAFVLMAILLPLLCTSQELTPAQQQEDFRILRDALIEGHGNLYRYTSKADMDARFLEVELSLREPQSLFPFYRKVAQLITAIRCGHTQIQLPSDTLRRMSSEVPLLPFRLRMIGDRLFVLRDLSGATPGLTGREILSINGISASTVIASLRKATPGDGEIETGRTAVIHHDWYANLNAEPLAGISNPFTLEVLDSRNQKVAVQAKGRNLTELREQWSKCCARSSQGAADLRFLPNTKTAVLIVRTFYGQAQEPRSMDLSAFFSYAFQEIRKANADKLILDLRNNPGGYDHLGVQLVSYLLDQPYQHYKDVRQQALSFSFEKYLKEPLQYPAGFFSKGKDGKYHATGHPNWGMQKNSEPGFRGKVWVLMNGGSFSTTSEVIAQLSFHRRAVFIGEESGGGYSGNNAGFMPVLLLPNSRIEIEIPLTAYDTDVKPATARGVKADYETSYSIQDLLKNRDKEMEVALKLR